MARQVTRTIRLDLLLKDGQRRRTLVAHRPVAAGMPQVEGRCPADLRTADTDLATTPIAELFQGVYDAALITDLTGRIVEANARALQHFSTSRQVLRTRNILDMIQGADQSLLDLIRRNLGNDRFTLVEAYCNRIDGRMFPTEISISCMRLQKHDYLCFFIRDITARKTAEEELEQHRNHLEELVAERTRELEQANRVLQQEIAERLRAEEEREKLEEQLRQAAKMQAVGQLAGGIAHDFNNLLTGVLGAADMLRRRLKNDERAVQYAEKILLAGRRAAELTDKLLAFARKGKFRSQPVNLHNVIDEVLALVNHGLSRRIVMRKELRATHPVTLGDPSQLENALLNVVINARDAMLQGGNLFIVTEDVELDEHFCRAHSGAVSPGEFILIRVRDTGVGMDEETLARVFEPFFTTKREGRGTGLGLASVYGTVKNHHGLITVESSPGQGSVFDIYLPVGEGEAPAQADKVPRDSDVGLRVLLVDDEEIVRDLGTSMLEEIGCSVTVCEDGADAVKYYRDHWEEIDLVLLDMIMPILGGAATYRALREVNPRVAVILASGYSLDDEAQKLVAEGAGGYIKKPFDINDLGECIRDLVSARTP